ncbi:sensor histidine kinase [Neobacillus cucumis]|uniref:sensor histidine kinase n=1 Tax=Neobacillus cucumis TaxID=1740721 RepID=UPI001963AE5E|nr:HAMP domain-containing sensor histidine kinase [Neobacillus cucumis]MBM7652822.1 two-component system sporulation sensor kinase B [Neobacillus cucumis]
MPFQYDQLLLQVLIVLIPIILYLALSNDKGDETQENIIWGVVCAITLALSIIFSIIIDGIRIDSRMVPWYLAFIYGGMNVGAFVSVCFFIVRFLYGGIGMIPSFFAMMISLVFIYWAQKKFHSLTLKKKIYLSFIYVSISSAMLPIIAVLFGREMTILKTIFNSFLFVVENGIMAWFAIYLIESHREKILLRKEIQRNEKMQVVGELAASVAHEIRNPMTSVKGFMQLLTEANNLTTNQKEFIQISLEELNRANDIITDYLSLGKNQAIKKQSVIDIGTEANKSIAALSSYATLHNVEVCIGINGQTVMMGNSAQLQQMFVNLIKNAIEAAEEKVNISIHCTQKAVDIFISNDGEGLTEEQIEKLGLPFYSTKEQGTGLGLMVTIQIIREMGGKWNVKSDKTGGTVFHITIPRNEGKLESSIKNRD